MEFALLCAHFEDISSYDKSLMHNDALDEVVISLPIVDTTARSCYIFNEFRVSTCGSFSLIDKFQGHFRWN